MKLEEEVKYKFDAGQTLFANMLWLLMIGVIIGFIVLAFGALETFEDETIRLLGFIVFAFATIKLIIWTGHPRIFLKERK